MDKSLAVPSPLTEPPGAWPYLAMVLSMLSFAGGTSFGKSLFPVVGAAGTSAYRVGLSAIVLLAFWRPWRFRLAPRELLSVAVYGASLGGMNLAFYLSLRTIPMGVAIAIEFTGPLAVSLVHSRRTVDLLWIGLVVLGLGRLLPLAGSAGQLDTTGVLFAATAGVFWALYIVFGKRAAQLHPGASVALGMTMAALVVVPFGVAEAGSALLDVHLLVAGALVACFSSVLPYSLEMVALRHVPKQAYGVVTSLEPVVGALAGLVVLHERLDLGQWLAIAAIVVAAAGSITSSARR